MWGHRWVSPCPRLRPGAQAVYRSDPEGGSNVQAKEYAHVACFPPLLLPVDLQLSCAVLVISHIGAEARTARWIARPGRNRDHCPGPRSSIQRHTLQRRHLCRGAATAVGHRRMGRGAPRSDCFRNGHILEQRGPRQGNIGSRHRTHGDGVGGRPTGAAPIRSLARKSPSGGEGVARAPVWPPANAGRTRRRARRPAPAARSDNGATRPSPSRRRRSRR